MQDTRVQLVCVSTNSKALVYVNIERSFDTSHVRHCTERLGGYNLIIVVRPSSGNAYCRSLTLYSFFLQVSFVNKKEYYTNQAFYIADVFQ